MSFLNRLKKKRQVETKIILLEDFFSASEAKTIIDEVETVEMKAAGLGKGGIVETNIRDALVGVAPVEGFLHSKFSKAISARLQTEYGIAIMGDPQFNILKYGPGGHYNSHADATEVVTETDGVVAVRTMDRDLSVILYLNDGYVGGSLTFIHTGQVVVPKAGLLVMFPSDWRHEHMVSPVEEGIRYAAVNWYRTDPPLIPAREHIPDHHLHLYLRG